jgi:hypothetical protein
MRRFGFAFLAGALLAATQGHAAEARDGQRDFDFAIGSWKKHVKRLVHPLTGSTTWVEYDGTTVCRKIRDGRGNFLELSVEGRPVVSTA